MDYINIRPAVLADLEILEFMHQQIVVEERPFGDTIKNEDVSYYNLEELIMFSDAQVLVAEFEGKVVASGYAKIIPSKDYYIHTHHAYLGFMYTLPEMWGKGLNPNYSLENLFRSEMSANSVASLDCPQSP